MEQHGTEAELSIRLDNAPTSTSFPVTLNDIVLGQIVTDSRGRGVLELGRGEDGHSFSPLPQGLTSLSPEMELVIGDIAHGQLSQVARIENSAPPVSSAELHLVATFEVVSGAVRSLEYEQEIENGLSKRKLHASIEKATPNATFDVSIAGTVVGKIVTDSRGKGTLRLSTIPKDGSESLFPANVPAVSESTEVAIGSVVASLRKQA